MKALQFDGQKLGLVDSEIPVPGRKEALIKVSYAGICNTDLEILRGYMGFTGILGHEFVGRVERAANPTLVGKHVVGEINLACGNCDFCRQGLGRHCPNRSVLGILNKDGAMAEYVTLPVQNLHVVPGDVGELSAVFTEPLAAACEIIEQLEILPEYRVLILGDGKLAQLVAQVLSLYTENLLLVGKHPEKLGLLRKSNLQSVLLKDFDSPEQSFHVVVEATGSWAGWELGLKMVRPRGFLVLKSTYAQDHPFNLAPVVINEINVLGSRCGSFSDALHFLRKKAVDTESLISGIFPVAQWEDAFHLAQKPEALKVLLEF